jgi:hypothetical protein
MLSHPSDKNKDVVPRGPPDGAPNLFILDSRFLIPYSLFPNPWSLLLLLLLHLLEFDEGDAGLGGLLGALD